MTKEYEERLSWDAGRWCDEALEFAGFYFEEVGDIRHWRSYWRNRLVSLSFREGDNGDGGYGVFCSDDLTDSPTTGERYAFTVFSDAVVCALALRKELQLQEGLV